MLSTGKSEAAACVDPFTPPRATVGMDPRILILNSSRFEREALRNMICGAIISAAIGVAGSLAEASRSLADDPADLLVTDVVACDGDVLGVLPDWMHSNRCVRRVFITSRHTGPHILETLKRYSIRGFFDELTDTPEVIESAARLVAQGREYLSPSVVGVMTKGVPADSDWGRLTITEKVVLAIVGTGIDDKEAAAELKLEIGTIRQIRGRLHRKLRIQRRSELMQAAESLGCVASIGRRVIRLGYAELLADYRKYARRR